MIKGSIKEGITIVNIYVPNIETPKNIKQILTDIKGEINNNTIIVRDFNTLLTSMDRSSRQKINKSLYQMHLIDIYRTFHPKTAFFSCAHGTFSRVDHMLGYKINYHKLKILKLYQAYCRPKCYENRNQLQGKKTAKKTHEG